MVAAGRLSDYVPEKLLASAGIVDTFCAHAEHLAAPVVLKVLFLDRAAGNRHAKLAAQGFLAAGRRMLQSPTPGMARALDVSAELEAAFVATELLDGTDLARLVALASKRGRDRAPGLDPTVAGLICAEVAQALALAHEQKPPLLHLGLCPGNVVVSPTADVTLVDAGLSAPLRQDGLLPLDKWLFVAPEIARAASAELSPEAAIAADLYALGALLHYLLSGRQPKAAASFDELSKPRTDAFADVDAAPKHLLAAVRALTAPDPKDRPDSAQAVAAWLTTGIESKRDRHEAIATLVQALGLGPAGKTGIAPAPAPAPKNVQATSGREAVAPSRRGRGPRSFLSRILAGLIVAAVAIGSWIALRSGPAGKATPKSETRTKPIASLRLGQPEIPSPRTAEGGPNAQAQAADRVYLPGPKQKLPRVPGRLFLATEPDRADVWIDGELKGKTPLDVVLGQGGHRAVVIKAGYRMLRAVYDTTDGEYVRKDLQRVSPPRVGDASLKVDCREANKYPVFLDDEETGLLCPVAKLPVTSGKHSVGIFVPSKRAVVSVEVTAQRGGQPVRVLLKD